MDAISDSLLLSGFLLLFLSCFLEWMLPEAKLELRKRSPLDLSEEADGSLHTTGCMIKGVVLV